VMLGEQPTVPLIAALALILLGVAVGISGGAGAPRRGSSAGTAL
jgi:hypothetical protein